jgi:hypothetical protein
VTTGEERGLVLIPPRVNTLVEYQDTTDMNVGAVEASIEAIDPIRDICLLAAKGVSRGAGIPVSGSDAVPPGTSVVTFSYPHAEHGRLVLTRQDARIGARVLIEASGVKSKHLILNVQTRPGQSGDRSSIYSRCQLPGS